MGFDGLSFHPKQWRDGIGSCRSNGRTPFVDVTKHSRQPSVSAVLGDIETQFPDRK
jgi:hypothetical protein